MSDTQQKFLDQKGVEYLWSKISMQDYPNNETLISVINAIDETKADKTEIPFIDDTLVLGDAAANAKAVGDALAEKADKQNGIYYVEGTENSTTSGLKGTSLEITELYEGLTIAYKMPIDFTANQPVFLRINDLQETRVYNIGTNYNFGPIAKGSIIIFVYTETDGLYYWHADWDRPQAQFGVDPSSEKRYLTATATIGGGITLLNTNDNCYMKDGELYSDNEKVGKHQNSIFYVVAGGTTNTWTASHSDITEYYDGLTIACRTTIGGGYPTTTLNINDLGAISIRRASGQDLTYAYKADSLLHLTYTIINGVGYWSMSDLWYTDTDAKVSSGNASNTKLFLVGAKTQNSNPTSGVAGYSNNGCYIGSDNLLYSNNKPVLTDIDNTLTVENMAADAAAVGEAIAAPKYVAQDTAPEDTNLLWIDTSDEVGTTADPKTEIILKSSTAGSTKQFRITINDDGILTATEIV